MAKSAPIFLDRDGTLIVEKHFIKDPADVRLETGVAEGLALDGSRPVFAGMLGAAGFIVARGGLS